MTQLAIYMEQHLAERFEKAKKASGKSKWASYAIQSTFKGQWRGGILTG